MSNVFQLGLAEELDYFSSVEFCDDRNIEFDALLDRLRADLGEGLAEKSLLGMASEYRNAILQCVKDPASLQSGAKSILIDALTNLINIRVLQKSRRKEFLNEAASIRRWELGANLTSGVSEFVNQLDRAGKISANGLSVFDYNLRTDAALLDWVKTVYRPVLRDYVGEAVMPVAHVRIANAIQDDNFWVGRYAHEYANFHWDSTPYSFPLIIYLDDVDECDGPFSYVDTSDKLQQDYVLRALHMGVHKYTLCDDGLVDKEKISQLPKILRNGERVGYFTGTDPFTKMEVKRVIGPCGTAALFDGFHLVHDGGFPKPGGSRRALFVNFRFPKQRLFRHVGRLAERFLRNTL